MPTCLLFLFSLSFLSFSVYMCHRLLKRILFPSPSFHGAKTKKLSVIVGVLFVLGFLDLLLLVAGFLSSTLSSTWTGLYGLPKPFPMWIVVTLCGNPDISAPARLDFHHRPTSRDYPGFSGLSFWCWLLNHKKNPVDIFPLKYWLFYRDPPSFKMVHYNWAISSIYNNQGPFFSWLSWYKHRGKLLTVPWVNCWLFTNPLL